MVKWCKNGVVGGMSAGETTENQEKNMLHMKFFIFQVVDEK